MWGCQTHTIPLHSSVLRSDVTISKVLRHCGIADSAFNDEQMAISIVVQPKVSCTSLTVESTPPSATADDTLSGLQPAADDELVPLTSFVARNLRTSGEEEIRNFLKNEIRHAPTGMVFATDLVTAAKRAIPLLAHKSYKSVLNLLEGSGLLPVPQRARKPGAAKGGRWKVYRGVRLLSGGSDMDSASWSDSGEDPTASSSADDVSSSAEPIEAWDAVDTPVARHTSSAGNSDAPARSNASGRSAPASNSAPGSSASASSASSATERVANKRPPSEDHESPLLSLRGEELLNELTRVDSSALLKIHLNVLFTLLADAVYQTNRSRVHILSPTPVPSVADKCMSPTQFVSCSYAELVQHGAKVHVPCSLSERAQVLHLYAIAITIAKHVLANAQTSLSFSLYTERVYLSLALPLAHAEDRWLLQPPRTLSIRREDSNVQVLATVTVVGTAVFSTRTWQGASREVMELHHSPDMKRLINLAEAIRSQIGESGGPRGATMSASSAISISKWTKHRMFWQSVKDKVHRETGQFVVSVCSFCLAGGGDLTRLFLRLDRVEHPCKIVAP